MFIVIGSMVVGIISGYLLRRISGLSFIKKLPSLFILMLLFSLGIMVGTNQIIIRNLSTIGLEAFIITAGAVSGSLCLSTLLYRKLFRKEEDKNEK